MSAIFNKAGLPRGAFPRHTFCATMIELRTNCFFPTHGFLCGFVAQILDTAEKVPISNRNGRRDIQRSNAFGLRNMIGMIFSHTEMTRLDHYYYYSSVVLNSLIRDAGLVRVKQRYYSLTLRRGKFKTFLKRTLFNKFIYRFRPGLSEGLVFFLKVKNT